MHIIYKGESRVSKNFIYKFSVILIIGFIIKMLGLLNRVIMARVLGIDGIALFSLVMPTMGLFITLSQFGLPIAVSKIVSENKVKETYSNRNIVIKCVIFSTILSAFLIVIFLSILRPLTEDWLRNDNLYYPLLMIIPLIPLCSFTAILKGYLNGHKIIDISSKSMLFEQIVRIIAAIILIFAVRERGIVAMVTVAIIAISIGEITALGYLLFKVSKMTKLKFTITKSEEKELNKVLKISLPITLSRIFSSISNFLEPIIFTAALLTLGIQRDQIARLFGSINSFALNLLLFLSFLTYTLSSILIPQVSELYVKKDYKKIENIVRISNFFCFYFAGLSTIILMLFPFEYMNLIYGSENGARFVLYMAPFFFVYYFQAVFVAVLQSANKAHLLLYINIFGNIIKLILIFFLTTVPEINANGLAIAIIFIVLFNTVMYYIILRKNNLYRINPKTLILGVGLIVSMYFLGQNLFTSMNNYLVVSAIIFMTYTIILYGYYQLKAKKLLDDFRNP